MTNNLRQSRVMKQYVAQRVGIYRRRDVEYYGRIGNLGTGAISVSGQPNSVYVTQEITGQVVTAVNRSIPNPALGLPVVIGYTPDAPAEMKVLRAWNVYGDAGISSVNNGVQSHHPQHEYPNSDTVWVWPGAIMDKLPTPAGLTVNIYPGKYRISGGWKRFQTTNVDLTSYVPSTAGKAKYVLIVVTSAGAFAVRDGSEITGYDALVDANIPEPTAGDWVICAVKLYAGQTAIRKDGDNDDFEDFRFSGAVGGTSIAQFYDSVSLASDQSVTSLADLTGMTLTKTLENGVYYRWKFTWTGSKTSVGTLSIFITDGSNAQKQANYLSITDAFGANGVIEFIELGTGASVTRKIRASVDAGSFNFDMDTNQEIVFLVEKCG